MPALRMPVYKLRTTAAASLCRVGTGRLQAAGDAAGAGHPAHGAVGFRGGIWGLQTKGSTAGEGLRRGCLPPWLLVHLPWMC